MYKPEDTKARTNGCEDYSQAYLTGERTEHTAEVHRIGSLDTRLVHLHGSTNENTDPASPDILVGLTLQGRAHARWSWGEEWYEIPHRMRGDFGLTPIDSEGNFTVTGEHRLLVVCLPLRKIKSLYDDEKHQIPLSFGELHTRYRKDNLVWELCHHLWNLARNPSPANDFAADATLLTLVSRFESLAQHAPPPRPETPTPLTPTQQEKLKTFVLAHLNVQITNQQLARHLNLPVRPLQDALQATTGETLRQYVLRLRVAHAITQIQSGTDLTVVALACGFTDHSHLCKAVRHLTGRPPSSFRKARTIS